MKRTKDELLANLKKVIGDNTSDDAVSLIEDITDTFDGSTGSSSDEDKKKIEELEQKLKDNDDMWRKKYTDRFFNPDPKNAKTGNEVDETEDEGEEEEEPTSFEELFSTEG